MSPFRGLFTGLLDDAAIFPPGDLPLAQAVPAHLAHRQSGYGDLVGPFVVGAATLDELAGVVDVLRPGSFDIALTVPAPSLTQALDEADRLPALRVVAVEVSVPDGMAPDEAVDLLRRRPVGDGFARSADDVAAVYVELPRDERRAPLLDALASAGYAAKLRTGGLTRDAHPGEDELASAVVAAVRAGVPFKATAGLHHAFRNTDPRTGFEQHGFLNLLVATAAARAGATTCEVARLLAECDPERVLADVREADPSVRASFRSFGTCSITEPVDELGDLGLLRDAAEVRA
ncbi:hypothetical protein SAMN04487968_1188 [Nocardioides terrae]|uniref:Uncharacterized protein n=1 Tax=Nocardioides terrae TaxID=574651 RepID=A0A1I1NL71_9ACTN|nr:hypothetical protein [Nocardioides terrae]SFC98032.1 hypothetical protein SAMN04487968_1188 [Nocardioides terrae]